MIKALLFDKDGTLFDFDATWGRWCKGFISDMSAGDEEKRIQFCNVFDFDFATSRFNPSSIFIAGTTEEILDQLLEIRPDLSPQQMLDEVNRTVSAMELAEVCDLRGLFALLKADYPLGIATNATESSARIQLDRAGILDDFVYVAGCDSGYGSKPDAGMCSAFAVSLNLNPSQVVMIGDSTHDILAGKAAGMRTLGVLTGPASREDLAPFADDVIASIADLPKWLSEQN